MAGKEYLLGNKAKDLLIYTMQVTMNTNLFPKSVRFTFAKELQSAAVSILRDIHSANECIFAAEYRRRLELIKAALDGCSLMLQLIEASLELKYIDLRRCKHWSGLVLNVKHMCAAWKKKDSGRAMELIAEEERQKLTMLREALK